MLRCDPGLIGRRRLHGLDRRPTALLEIRELGEGAAGCLATLTRPSGLVLLDQPRTLAAQTAQLIDPGVELAPPAVELGMLHAELAQPLAGGLEGTGPAAGLA